MGRRKKKYIEGIIEKVNFPNMSEFTFEDKKVNFKGGILCNIYNDIKNIKLKSH